MFNQRLSVKNFNRSLVPLANSNRAEVKKKTFQTSVALRANRIHLGKLLAKLLLC